MMHWGHPEQDKVTLFLGDSVLISLAAGAGRYLILAEKGSAIHLVATLLVLLPAYLAAIYVFDLYSLAALNGLGTFVRAMLAVGAGSGFCYVFFHLSQWENPSYRSLGICTLVLPPATYVWRKFYFHGSRSFRTAEELIFVGTAKDAAILSGAVEQWNSRFHLFGMLRTEGSGAETQSVARDSQPTPLVRGSGISVSPSSSFSAGTAVALAREPISASAVVVAGNGNGKGVLELGPATSENLLRVVAESDVKAVVVRSDVMTSDLAGVLTRMRFNGIRVYSLLDFCMRASEELPLEVLNEFWLCVADGFDLLQARLFRRIKRLGDIFLAGLGLVVTSPFMIAAAIAIRLDSDGPVLFRQRRVGWMGRPFELLKFRSMHAGAEKEGEPQWAAMNDPRVTGVGKILRKTHFDELPQMINILRGEMSFVGPRPERPEFVELLNESITFYHLRHYVLPGITGWAQVNYPYGASLEDARRKLQYDLYYMRNASPFLDLRTLLRTARVVLFRRGSR
jgi:lipopolysaccharide/colanic/teichoic acid biosynthesis glycosyltransferase